MTSKISYVLMDTYMSLQITAGRCLIVTVRTTMWLLFYKIMLKLLIHFQRGHVKKYWFIATRRTLHQIPLPVDEWKWEYLEKTRDLPQVTIKYM